MKKLVVFVFLVFSFASCKKDKDSGYTCTQDMAGFSGTYKVTAVSYKANTAAAEQDFYNQF